MRIHLDLKKLTQRMRTKPDGELVSVVLYECLCGQGRIGVTGSLQGTYKGSEWVILCEHCKARWQVVPSIGMRGISLAPRDDAPKVEPGTVVAEPTARNIVDDDETDESSGSTSSSGSGGGPDVPEKEIPVVSSTDESVHQDDESDEALDDDDDELPPPMADDDDDWPDDDDLGDIDMDEPDYGEMEDDDEDYEP